MKLAVSGVGGAALGAACVAALLWPPTPTTTPTTTTKNAAEKTLGVIAANLETPAEEAPMLGAIKALHDAKDKAADEKDKAAKGEQRAIESARAAMIEQDKAKIKAAELSQVVVAVANALGSKQKDQQSLLDEIQHLQTVTAKDVQELMRQRSPGTVLGLLSKAHPKDDEAKRAIQAARGAARWKLYKYASLSAKKKVGAGDDDVKEAVKELKEADTAEAALVLGEIAEVLGKRDEAGKIYKNGLEQFKEYREAFQAALDRLATEQKPGRDAGRLPDFDPVEATALLLTSLQPAGTAADAPDDSPADFLQRVSGYFYAAAARAKEGKFKEAYENLDQADKLLALHASEGTPEMLRRSLSLVRAYWEFCQRLSERGLVTEKDFAVLAAASTPGEVLTKVSLRIVEVDGARKKAVADFNVANNKANGLEETVNAVAAKLGSGPKKEQMLQKVVSLTQDAADARAKSETLKSTVDAVALKLGAGAGSDKTAIVNALDRLLAVTARPDTADAILRRGRELLQLGDVAGAVRLLGADPAKGGVTKDLLAARGEAYWLSFLQKRRKAGQAVTKIDKESDDVKKIIEVLKKADTAEALLTLGHIEELAGDEKAATSIYGDGLRRFPEHGRVFQSALDRLGTRPDGAPMGALPGTAGSVVVLLFPVLPDDPDAAEAGFKFIDAVKAARAGNYDVALAALAEAREVHERQRLVNPQCRANPVSDPNDVIFSRCCQQLDGYWSLRKSLKAAGVDLPSVTSSAAGQVASLSAWLDKMKTSTPPVRYTLDPCATLCAIACELSRAGHLLPERDLVSTVRDIIREHKQALACNVRLKAEVEAARGECRHSVQERDRAVAEVKATAANLADAKRRLGEADSTLQAAAVAAGSLPERDALLSRLSWLRCGHSPEQLLQFWCHLLADPGCPDVAKDALADVDRILQNNYAPGGAAATRALARAVEGLALRNEGHPAAARAALENALNTPSNARPEQWRSIARAAAAELTSPEDYFAGKARTRLDAGNAAAAVEMLNLGLKELPASRKLLALRSEAHLALAERVGGKLVPTDTHAEQARRDADMALPDGDSSGPYAAGRVAEEDGNLEAAETHFRQALALQPADLRYQASLARVLLSSELSRRTGANPSSGSYDSSEATRLVEAVIAGGQPEGLLLRSRLLALRGEWTQGLREFATGLSESGRVPSGYATDLTRLVSNHPILQRPASAERPDRRRAELSYYEGVSLYVGGAYAEAERAFSEAVRYGSLDARYWYYLGASQFQLGKLHLADDCFRQAAQREQVNLPEASELAEALERLQGAPRQAMRRYHR